MLALGVGARAETYPSEKMVDLGNLGLPPMVLPLLTYASDMMVLASPASSDGAVVIFQRRVEPESMVDLARSFGMAIDPEPDYYRG